MTHTPLRNAFSETDEQRLADAEKAIRQTHDFLRVTLQVLRRRNVINDADLADITTICPRISAQVIGDGHRRHGQTR